jgi:tetratricopeptide (TPR) repeat protein
MRTVVTMLGFTKVVRFGGAATAALTPLLVLVSLGCDLTKLTGDQTAALFHRGSPAIEQYWDYETAGAGFPGTILQLEAVARVVPENDHILYLVVQSYVAFAYGWLEDRVEALEIAGEMDEAAEQRVRARQAYTRARDVGFHWIRLEHEEFDDVKASGVEDFEAWLQEEFDDEDDAEQLFWVGYGWGSYINLSLDDISAVADLGFAKSLVARSVELDPTYFHASGLVFLGVAETQELSGNMDRAKELFERALAETERKSLIVHVNMARYWAVKAGDRDLYVQLLTEVIEAGNPDPEQRLNNVIAQRRARRYLAQVDEVF